MRTRFWTRAIGNFYLISYARLTEGKPNAQTRVVLQGGGFCHYSTGPHSLPSWWRTLHFLRILMSENGPVSTSLS